MATKKSKSPTQKGAKKPATAKKLAKKASQTKSPAKKPGKAIAKKPVSAKKVVKPSIKQKVAPKPVKKNTAAKKVPVAKSKKVVDKIVKKEIVKTKPLPAAKVSKKEVKPISKVENAPKGKKVVVQAEPIAPPPSNLPKLPKGFVLKKQKGKLAPGEKRLFKTNVITHHVISEVPLDEAGRKGKPEPKGKFQLEYIIHTPVTLLYDFLTTPNGLAEWFADGIDLKNDIYTFDWDGQKQSAKILSAKIDNHIRLRWLDKAEGTYFEFRLNQDELTNEVSLNITDFGDGDDDIATSRRLWDSQIQRLVKALGTY
ncbi:hypothetical protein BH09BAC5_BH09BAC5_25610 [soil metagenome]